MRVSYFAMHFATTFNPWPQIAKNITRTWRKVTPLVQNGQIARKAA
jgi:ABC-type Zn uptake system ZnuABC Zn-binding protein ZnuA